MAVLVTGGAGYIGAHMVRSLVADGRDVVVLDDLSSGRRDAVPAGVPLVVGDVGDRALAERVLREHGVDAIVHFAALIRVGESVADPRRYWTTNVGATLSLLEAALDAHVRNVIFSSTAAVYGIPESVPITEGERLAPINPYGESKLTVERVLASYARAYGVSYAALRYFNASGADADAGIGERHDPETHLIPLVLDAALGRRPSVAIYGDDYPTADGTCVRDYIHVVDLAEAHTAALAYLERGGESGAFNLGAGVGYSVAEVINACSEVTGREIPVTKGKRRPGDPPVLVASPRRAESRFGWRARRSSIDRIVADAWAFHLRAFGPEAFATPPDRPEEQPETPLPRRKEKQSHVPSR